MERAAFRIEVTSRHTDFRGRALAKRFQSLGIGVQAAWVADCYLIDGPLSSSDAEKAARALASPVTQEFRINAPVTDIDFDHAIEIGFLPGVTDNVAHTAREVIEDLLKMPLDREKSVFSSTAMYLKGISADDALRAAREISNELINRVTVRSRAEYLAQGGFGQVMPVVHMHDHADADIVPLPSDDAGLLEIGKKGIKDERGYRGPLALDLDYMHTIRNYFHNVEKREPTDIEIESIAQTWSEHCKHTIFAASIDGDDAGVFKRYIRAATMEIIAERNDGFCVSVFSDNAGGITFDENWIVSDKVETHNSPSALDPFGGAITGIVGVNRDEMGFGMGARPIANRFGFCFAYPEDTEPLYRGKDQSTALLSPRRIMEGVVAGVNSGGNCSGIPTPQGFVYFDPRYKGKPLVFVGTVGLLPRTVNGKPSHEKQARPGDLVVVAGGRVGLDGIHGATFSSEALTEGSPAGAVQIGDPITQKKMSDAIVKEARDRGLYTSITDNGAGGISCSVAEMAKEAGGFEVALDTVPLKYPGLAPWQIWVSESQERMTFAVPEEKVSELLELFSRRGVEATVIGRFTDSGRGKVTWHGKTVFDIDMDFLHNGLPQRRLTTVIRNGATSCVEFPEPDDYAKTMLALINRHNLASFQFISRQFDHEVLGVSCTKPLQGPGKVNAFATVISPVPDSPRGVALSQGLFPSYSEIDPYRMSIATIDTAIRHAVSAGADPDQTAILDNFCWCDSLNPERLGQLTEAARGCYDAAKAYRAPFVSGKDSMFNDFKGYDRDFNPVNISVPPTLLVSAIAIVPEAVKAQTLDFKAAGDAVYLVGPLCADEIAGSEYARLREESGVRTGGTIPDTDMASSLRACRSLHRAIRASLPSSVIAPDKGGLFAALALSCMGGLVGADIALDVFADRMDFALFAETPGRFVVSVRPDAIADFERTMGDQARRIGTTGGDALSFTKNGESIARLTVTDLRAAYTARLAGY